ncbi:unnamed protein product [Coregonus sp. 'balchen']|nr:unnamed protein product [Coregonus sp. 'balchen']
MRGRQRCHDAQQQASRPGGARGRAEQSSRSLLGSGDQQQGTGDKWRSAQVELPQEKPQPQSPAPPDTQGPSTQSMLLKPLSPAPPGTKGPSLVGKRKHTASTTSKYLNIMRETEASYLETLEAQRQQQDQHFYQLREDEAAVSTADRKARVAAMPQTASFNNSFIAVFGKKTSPRCVTQSRAKQAASQALQRHSLAEPPHVIRHAKVSLGV